MTVDQISNDFVRDIAALSPMAAVYIGLPSERLLDDLSPAGLAEQSPSSSGAHSAAVGRAPIDAEAEQVAADVLTERLQLDLDRYEAGDFHLGAQRHRLARAGSPHDVRPAPQGQRRRLSPTSRRGCEAVPEAFAGYVESLLEGVRRGRVAAIRQVDKCAEQCDTYSGSAAATGYFTAIASGKRRTGALADELAAAAAGRRVGLRRSRHVLANRAAPACAGEGCGRSRGVRAGVPRLPRRHRRPRGDLPWGWKEFLGLEAELKEVCGRIRPGATPREVSDQLDNDARYQVTGTDGLQRWMQQLSDEAVDELGRTHFDVPEPIRTLDCKIAPPGGTVGAYYTGPSDDLSRPGAMWWSVEPGREVFSTWREVTTVVYHEGVPGHHLQIATAVYQRDSLNDFQRLLAGTSGHAEGWALYAERLMRELGYLDDDPVLLGMLDAQLFRAARVVVDIGMHLELEIPGGTGFHEGERWTPELGLEFLLTRTVSEPEALRRRDRPLPRVARPSAELQGRRAGLDRWP